MQEIFWLTKYFYKKVNIKYKLIFLCNLFIILIAGLLEFIYGFSLVSLGGFLTGNINQSSIINNLQINLNLNYEIFLACLLLTSSFILTSLRICSTYLNLKISSIFAEFISSKLTKSFFEETWLENKKIVSKSSFITTLVNHNIDVKAALGYLFSLITSFILSIFIISGLAFADISTTLNAVISLGFAYFLISQVTFKRIDRQSKIAAATRTMLTRFYSDIYEASSNILNRNLKSEWQKEGIKRYNILTKSILISGMYLESPRFIIEFITILLLCSIILFLNNFNLIISIAVFLFVIVTRLVPNVQKVFNYFSLILAIRGSVQKVKEAIVNNESNPTKNFLKNNYSYSSLNNNFQNLNIKIKPLKNLLIKDSEIELQKGQLTLLMGKSGSGKTTISKIISMIPNQLNDNYQPLFFQAGRQITIPRTDIEYAPQKPYIFTGSTIDNICLTPKGHQNKLEKSKLEGILKASLLLDLYNQIGDLDISEETCSRMVSGGQLQRISFARAISSKAKILILDEITSSLDNETKLKIIKNVTKFCFDKYLLLVTHDRDLMKFASKVYFISNKKLKLLNLEEKSI